MLVICNGAIKSGSTWLFNIVSMITGYSWPPDEYLTGSNSKHPTIPSAKLLEFLRSVEHEHSNYISKNHYGRQETKDLLLSDPDVLVIDMERDCRDVVVSSYYEACRQGRLEGDFEAYYWREGRALVAQLTVYHQLWGDAHPQMLVTSFECLKQDFRNEVRRLGAFIGFELSDAVIAEIERSTHIDKLREAYKDDSRYASEDKPFFRKGEIGDWHNHFDEKMTRDMEKIERHGLGRCDRIELLNSTRRKLAHYWSKFAQTI